MSVRVSLRGLGWSGSMLYAESTMLVFSQNGSYIMYNVYYTFMLFFFLQAFNWFSLRVNLLLKKLAFGHKANLEQRRFITPRQCLQYFPSTHLYVLIQPLHGNVIYNFAVEKRF